LETNPVRLLALFHKERKQTLNRSNSRTSRSVRILLPEIQLTRPCEKNRHRGGTGTCYQGLIVRYIHSIFAPIYPPCDNQR
jgi:hypothetical protein